MPAQLNKGEATSLFSYKTQGGMCKATNISGEAARCCDGANWMNDQVAQPGPGSAGGTAPEGRSGPVRLEPHAVRHVRHALPRSLALCALQAPHWHAWLLGSSLSHFSGVAGVVPCQYAEFQ